MNCTISVAKTRALISFAITGADASLVSHMHDVGFIIRRINY